MESKDTTNIDLIEEEEEIKQKISKNSCDSQRKAWIIIVIFCSILIFGIIFIFIVTNDEGKNYEDNFNYEIIQSDLGYQNVLVNWTFNETFDISINVKGVESEIIRTYNIYNTNQGEQLVKVYYGKPKLYIKVIKDGKASIVNKELTIPAKEILIAAFYASLPPLMFTLDIFNITSNFNCPIYVALERYKTWNWDNIPERILMFDFLDLKNFKIDFNTLLNKMKIWIGQIHQVNSETLFHLFITDYHNFILPLCVYSNNIPNENINIYLLSDGVGSFNDFNSKFDNNETYINTYNELKRKYAEFKEYIWNQKRYDKYSSKGKNIRPGDLRYYVYIILKEEKNTYWWLTRIKGVFVPHNPALLEELLNNKNISVKDLNSLFKSLNSTEKKEIKNLLNFNSNYFEEAYKLNKSIMLFAGTSGSDEKNLIDYCLTAESFYKDDYIYYYKAHPASPIENNPKKIEQLKNIKVTPIDSNIPVEVIIFFNPKVVCSGYYTSAFIELEKERLGTVFNQYKKDDVYFNRFDYFCQYIKKDNEKYGKYLDNNNDGVVLEINKNKLIDFKYDFGIYFKNNNSINYYNQ